MSVTRETPIGTPVLADVAEYPRGYAWGEEPTGHVRVGTLWGIEGDAGIDWCFVEVDEPGDGPEYMHVPMSRVQTIADRLEELRTVIDAECISYSELFTLQHLAKFIEPGDVQLLEWAGVPEFPDAD